MSKYVVVSQLDADGIFVGVTHASESPLEPGVYLYPRGTIDAPPPNIPEGFFARWENKWVLVQNPDSPEIESSPEPELIPTLSPAQFWMQLAINGDEEQALLLIQALPRPQQILATKASEYRRDNLLLINLATALGKSSQQIDEFFITAATLS